MSTTKRARTSRKSRSAAAKKAAATRARNRAAAAAAAERGGVFTLAEQFGLDARGSVTRGNEGRHNGEGVVSQ